MKTAFVKKSFVKCLVAAGALILPFGNVSAVSAPAEECAKELLLSYFPAPIVRDTLKKFNVPQDKWDGIVKSLSQKDKEVVRLVEQKASEMTPNPLKDPQQRQAAVKLFRETLFQVFSEAMKDNDVADPSKYQAMLDDVQQQKAKRFAMCMEKQKQKADELDKAADEQGDTDEDAGDDDTEGDDEDEDSDEMDDEEDDNEKD